MARYVVITPGMGAVIRLCAALGASLSETAREVGVDKRTLHEWSKRRTLRFAFRGRGRRGTWTLKAAMEDQAALRMLALACAERGLSLRQTRDELLWTITSRPEPARDVAAALAKLEAA